MSNVFVLPRQTPLTSAGRVYPGAKAYFYRTGTATPKDVYSDAAHMSPILQPVEADLGGTFPTIYLDTSTEEYRLTLKTSADALIYTVDDVGGRLEQAEFDVFFAGLSAAQIGQVLFRRTASEISNSVVPTDYSRRPGDFVRYGLSTLASSTVNAAAINNALLCNSYCFCDDPGTYTINTKLLLQSNQTLRLAQGVTIKADAAGVTGATLLSIDTCTNSQVFGGVFDGNKAGNAAGTLNGVAMLNSHDIKLFGVTSQNCPSDNTTLGAAGDGFYIGGFAGGSPGCTNIEMIGCTSSANVRQGLSIVRADNVKVIGGSYIGTTGNNPGGGIDCEANPGLGSVTNVMIIGVDLSDNYRALILTEASFDITVLGCKMLRSRESTVLFANVTNCTFIGNVLKPQQTVDGPIMDFPNSTNVLVQNNVIVGQGAASTHEGAAIRFAIGSSNIIFKSNLFQTVRLQALALGSSALAGVPTLIDFSDNTMIDCVDAATFTTTGVIGVGGNTGTGQFPLLVTIRDNIIRDTRGTPAAFGIKLVNIPAATSADYRIDRNRVSGPTTAFNDNVATVPPLCGLVTWNPANLADGAGETSPNITVLGAALGDAVEVFPPYSLQSFIHSAYVSATDTVVIRIQNESGVPIDLASGTWQVRVKKLTQA